MATSHREKIEITAEIGDKYHPLENVSLSNDGAFSSFQSGKLTIEQEICTDIEDGKEPCVNYGVIGDLISDLMEKMGPIKFWELCKSSTPLGWGMEFFGHLRKKGSNDEQ